DHQAANLRRQLVEPDEAVHLHREALGEPDALPGPQLRAYFEHEITLGRGALGLELRIKLRRERPRSGAQLEDVAAGLREYLARLQGDALREERRDLGGRDEVALGAELARAAGVVAQALRIERELHVARERDPVVGVRDRLGDVRRGPLRMPQRLG